MRFLLTKSATRTDVAAERLIVTAVIETLPSDQCTLTFRSVNNVLLLGHVDCDLRFGRENEYMMVTFHDGCAAYFKACNEFWDCVHLFRLPTVLCVFSRFSFHWRALFEINEIRIQGRPHKYSENIYFSTIAIFPLFSIRLSPT